MFKATDSNTSLAGGASGSMSRMTVGDVVQRVRDVDSRAVDRTGAIGAESELFSNLLKDLLADVRQNESSGLAGQPGNSASKEANNGLVKPSSTGGNSDVIFKQVPSNIATAAKDQFTFRECFMPYEQASDRWPICGDVRPVTPTVTATPTKGSEQSNVFSDKDVIATSAPSRPRILALERTQIVDQPVDQPTDRLDDSRATEVLRQGNGRPGNQQLEQIVRDSGEYHGVDPNLALAVAYAESSLRVDAVSRDGHDTKGLFQLMDSTAHDMRDHLGLAENYRPFDPKHNAFLGTGYMKFLFDSFNSETALNTGVKTIPVNDSVMLERTVLAAYNCGLGTVARAQNRVGSAENWEQLRQYLPSTTVSYVERVMALKQNFANQYNNLSPKMNALA